MDGNLPLILFVSYCVGVPLIIFLAGLFGHDKESANTIAILWPILVPSILVAFFCFGLYWCGAAIHSFGEYLHDKLTPDWLKINGRN